MSMYEKFADDVSESLFKSIYSDMFALAVEQQKAIYEGSKKKRKGVPINYHAGEHQENLNAWCKNKLSLGDALDYIRINKRS